MLRYSTIRRVYVTNAMRVHHKDNNIIYYTRPWPLITIITTIIIIDKPVVLWSRHLIRVECGGGSEWRDRPSVDAQPFSDWTPSPTPPPTLSNVGWTWYIALCVCCVSVPARGFFFYSRVAGGGEIIYIAAPVVLRRVVVRRGLRENATAILYNDNIIIYYNNYIIVVERACTMYYNNI